MLNTSANPGTVRSPIAQDVPKLLAAAPIFGVYQQLDRHVTDLRRLAPASDATAALTLYRDKLSVAIQRARQLELFVSAEQASLVLGKSASMITYLCRTGALKAKKVGGTWQIDRLEIERMRAAAAQEGVADTRERREGTITYPNPRTDHGSFTEGKSQERCEGMALPER